MRQYPDRVLPALVAVLLLSAVAARSAPDTTGTDAEERILFIGSLGFDCHPDTITGFRMTESPEAGFLPRRIRWGMPLRDTSDTPGCGSRTPRQKRVKQTVFTYPGWEHVGGSVAFQRLNADSLPDIIIHLRGAIERNGERRDTLLSVVLFSQHGLDSIRVVPIGAIGRFQARPFFAMQLVRGAELTSPRARDLSGRTSYVLEPVALELDRPDSTPPPTTPAIAGAEQPHDGESARMRVYPNPTGSTLNIEAMGLRQGAYRIELVSVNGETELRQHVTIEEGAGFRRALDVGSLPHGYYVVRIDGSDGTSLLSAPIIITR